MDRLSTSLATLCVASLSSAPCQSQEQTWSFDIRGQVRERFESANNPVFGLSPPLQNDYLLHRAMLSAEAHSTNGSVVLVELVSSLTSGWQGPPPPTQEDPLDVLQAFIEMSLPVADEELAVRIGRQELKFGSARLVSVRESPNVRRAFDGIRASWVDEDDRSATAFLVRTVLPEDGVFDDRSSRAERFWGIYATWPAPEPEGLGFDSYYLGLDKAEAAFAQGVARERRHTVGARTFGERADWDWDIEAVWQWGSFGDSSIRAWTVSVDAGFQLAALPLAPRIGLKADVISGDRDLHDARLGTFNPLYPRLPYFSEANLVTPANLFDVQPNLRLSLTGALSATFGWNKLWKYEAADAVYAPLLSPIEGTALSPSRDIGWQASALVEWRPTKQLELGATYVTFEPDAAMQAAGGRAGSFFSMWIRWTF